MATESVNSGPSVGETIADLNALLAKQTALTKATNKFSVATAMINARGEAINKGARNLSLQN